MTETPFPQFPTMLETPFDLRTCSTSELFSFLKTSFVNKDYDDVERVITERQIKLKQEKAEIEAKYRKLLKEVGILNEQHKQYMEELGAEVSRRLELEDDCTKNGSEIVFLKENIARLEGEKLEISGKVKWAEERVRELNEEIEMTKKQKHGEILGLVRKNKKLEMENRQCHAEIEGWKKNMAELEERVSNLNDRYEALVLADVGSHRKYMNHSELGVNSGSTAHAGAQTEHLESSLKCEKTARQQLVSESDHPKERATSSRLCCYSGDIIHITDSEDDEQFPSKSLKMEKNGDILRSNYKMKELQVSTPGSSKQSSTRAASATQNRCEEEEAVERRPGISARLCSGGAKNHLESDSSDYEGEIFLNPLFKKLLAGCGKDGEANPWEFEADMLDALERNSELCMKAVCALHKCNTFNSLDAFRGRILAGFLVGGDPEGGLKKSVTEFLQYDPRGVDDCRRIATAHSRQLFNIYMKKSDPLFVP